MFSSIDGERHLNKTAIISSPEPKCSGFGANGILDVVLRGVG